MENGVLVVKKDSYLPKHQHITSCPNLIVQMVIKSLKSKGLVDEVFNWQWAYYFVNEAGVKYLVKALDLPADVVPQTYKKTKMAKDETAKTKKGADEESDDEKPKATADGKDE